MQLKSGRRVAASLSRGICDIPFINNFLGGVSVRFISQSLSYLHDKKNIDFVVGWGRKNNTLNAIKIASNNGIPYISLEDGFIRSIGLGVNKCPPLSIVVDDIGMYYDARTTSRLEVILNGDECSPAELSFIQDQHACAAKVDDEPLNDDRLIERSRTIINKIVTNKISKYNSSPEVNLGKSDRYRVLVVDQTMGDLSVSCGGASEADFRKMLTTAMEQFPDAEIIVKIHPDVVAGKKKGYLQSITSDKQIRVISENVNPISLIEQVNHVFVVTSQLGFEALLVGKPVTCFGAPFYAGWGLTTDYVPTPRRKRKRSIEQLFAAAYILYSRYIDPNTGAACNIEQVVDHLVAQRHWHSENSGKLYCYGFSLWKRAYVRKYLQSPWNEICFVNSTKLLLKKLNGEESKIVVWGTKTPKAIFDFAKNNSYPLWRMEDGFLRSNGLGSDFASPVSLVLDKSGIYYDPTTPSDLERVLQTKMFSNDDLSRANHLMASIISSRLNKYNVGKNTRLKHTAKPGQKIIFVPGQVEDDESIRLGSREINTNAKLLSIVRQQNPDAYILFKPHPDVVAGNRKESIQQVCLNDYDQLIIDINLIQCLDVADEIHTITSLVGFEGLIRNKKVKTYGLPFYSGWGLTDDYYSNKRRTRKLKIEELVSACLVSYPRYMNYTSNSFSNAEDIVDFLRVQRSSSSMPQRLSGTWTQRKYRKCKHLLSGLIYEF